MNYGTKTTNLNFTPNNLAHNSLFSIFHSTADPETCKFADCTKNGAEVLCPRTCLDNDPICVVIDCSLPQSVDICPKTCAKFKEHGEGNQNKMSNIIRNK